MTIPLTYYPLICLNNQIRVHQHAGYANIIVFKCCSNLYGAYFDQGDHSVIDSRLSIPKMLSATHNPTPVHILDKAVSMDHTLLRLVE